jgi:hypothetical protein
VSHKVVWFQHEARLHNPTFRPVDAVCRDWG